MTGGEQSLTLKLCNSVHQQYSQPLWFVTSNTRKAPPCDFKINDASEESSTQNRKKKHAVTRTSMRMWDMCFAYCGEKAILFLAICLEKNGSALGVISPFNNMLKVWDSRKMYTDTKFCQFQFLGPKSFWLRCLCGIFLQLARLIFSVTKLDQNVFCGKPALANTGKNNGAGPERVKE